MGATWSPSSGITINDGSTTPIPRSLVAWIQSSPTSSAQVRTVDIPCWLDSTRTDYPIFTVALLAGAGTDESGVAQRAIALVAASE